MPVVKKSISINPGIESKLSARGDNLSGTINRDLERYYALLDRALHSVPLTEQEAWFLLDLLNGTFCDVSTAEMLWAEAQDGIEFESMDQKWAVDGAELVKKLQGLNALQALALVDAVERFWERHNFESVDNSIVRKYFSIPE